MIEMMKNLQKTIYYLDNCWPMKVKQKNINKYATCFMYMLQASSYLQIWIRYWDVIVLPLILCKQFKPATDRTSEDLTDAEWQRSHKIIPGRPVPVPHLHRQTPVPLVATNWAEETQNSSSSGVSYTRACKCLSYNGTESIQTPLHFPVSLQPFAEIKKVNLISH